MRTVTIPRGRPDTLGIRMPDLLLAVAVVSYNALLNRWPPFHEWAYVPVNLAAGAILVALALGPFGLSPARIGFAGGVAPAFLGIATGAALTAPLFLLARSRRAHLIADARAAPDDVLYRTLVRIPFGTALFEEVVFRGVLLGVLLDYGRSPAVLLSALAFGLWHVEPARAMARLNRRPVGVTIIFTVLVTALAGMALGLLRLQSGGLALPVALHATVNALAHLASRQALRSTF